MPCLKICLSISLTCISKAAWAVAMKAILPGSSIGLGLGTLYLEQPDSKSEQRYRLDLQHYERLFANFRLHNRLGVARDTRPRSDAVEVKHHIYDAQSSLQWTGTKLFRFGMGAGPLLLLEQTVTRIQFNETSEQQYNRWQLGWLAEAQLDYAMSDRWELALNFAWQFRPLARKQDFCFGVNLMLNAGITRQDEDNPAKAVPALAIPPRYRQPD
jgi:hypothetical protein